MDLEAAILTLRKAVKFTGTIEQKHIDLTLVPVDERPKYEKALVVAQLAVREGKLSRDELMARLQLL